MKLILTGGHFSPALSLIDELPKDTEILIVGRKHTFEGDKNTSFEYKTAQSLGIPFQGITTGRLQRTFTRYTIPSLLKLPIGIAQAFRIVQKYKPDVVLSFGGYISFPVVLACAVLRVPVVVHEQTLKTGLANKIASGFAKKVCISWESSRKYFPALKTVLTGNPMRKFTIGQLPFKISQEKIPLIYITGGSTGSHTINNAIMDCLDTLLSEFRVIHQVGDSWEFKDFDKLEKLRNSLDEKLQNRYFLTKFVDPSFVGSLITAADLLVSRSGMNTITELIYFEKPALLIPLNSEQMDNALFFKKLGLGQILDQDLLTGEKLFFRIKEMQKNTNEYKKNASKAKVLLRNDAAKRIIKELNSLYSIHE